MISKRQVRDSVRVKMRIAAGHVRCATILIRQLLRKYKYPPEGYEEAITLVLKQAEALTDEWTAECP
ncbi:MAG: DUF3387 domain-containing protein [Verrucomicrobiae bacterium]|nr:DUF3387 domain-containing protein [Verrucomicrobiae bacterium]